MREFPDLADEKRLVDASKRVAEGEQGLVEQISSAVPPAPQQDANDSVATVTLASRFGANVTELVGQVHPVLVRGSVYMFDMSNGQVLWRRFVGYETNIQPQWVNGAGSDVIVASQRDQEVLRIEARTGQVVWRSRVGTPFASMTVASNGVVVAARDGHVVRIAIDAVDGVDAGTIVEGVQIPQPLFVGPAVDRSGRYLYQPGLEANIYVLESVEGEGRMECREVYYLGHAKGSVVVPPILVQGLLFIVENSGLDYSNLHILRPTQRGLGLEPAQNPIRLRGEVLAAAEIYGPQGLVVLTDRGETRVFQVDPTVEDEAPVSLGPGFDRQTPPGTYSFFLANRGQLWVGDDGLNVMSIQTQRGRIERQRSLFPGNQYLGPFAVYGSVLVQTRQRAGSELVTVSAHQVDTMDEVWSTNLGAPLAGPPHREVDGSLVLVTSEGDQYVLTEELVDAEIGFEPRRRGSNTEIDLVFHSKVDFGQGRAILFGPPGKRRVLGIDPSQRVNPAPISDLGLPDGTLAFPPIRFGEYVLAGSTAGPLFLLDSLRAQGQGVPFQPPTGPDQNVVWARPCVLDNDRFVIADADGNVYRIRRDGRSLAKDDQGLLEGRVITPLANLGSTVFVGVMRGNAVHLVHLDANDLNGSESSELPGEVTFGPIAQGSLVLLSTSDGALHAFDDQGALAWSLEIDSPVVGVSNGETADQILVATSAGSVLVVNAGDGELERQYNAGEPLGGEPFLEAGRLFAPTFDGSLRVLPKP